MLYKALLLSAVRLALSLSYTCMCSHTHARAHTKAHIFALKKVNLEVWALVSGLEQALSSVYESNAETFSLELYILGAALNSWSQCSLVLFFSTS